MRAIQLSMLWFLVTGTANAGVIVNIAEVGPNVVLSYNAGTLDTTGLTLSTLYSGGNVLFTGAAGLIGGGPTSLVQSFTGGSSPITVTTSGGWTQAGGGTAWSSTTGTGSLIGGAPYLFGGVNTIFIGDDPLRAFVGVNSISGASGTANGQSYASLGLTGGQFITFSWAADSLTFTTGGAVAAVPEPTSIAMLGTGALGLLFAARKRRQTKLAA